MAAVADPSPMQLAGWY